MPDLDIELDQPERKTVTLTEPELKQLYPVATSLAYGHLQHYNLQQRRLKLETKALTELVKLVGKGSLSTELMGKSWKISLGSTPNIIPNEAQEPEVKEAYGLAYSILEDAVTKGLATKFMDPAVSILLPRETNDKKPSNQLSIETALANVEKRDTQLSLPELREKAPNLVKFLFCHFQNKDLEKKLKVLQKKVNKEFENIEPTTIKTVLNKEEVMITSFKQPRIKLNSEDPSIEAELKAARLKPSVLLKALLSENKATKDTIYYVLPNQVK